MLGRPSIYTNELCEIICARIALGESLNKIVTDDAMPAMTTVFRWLREKEDFRHNYEAAKAEQAELFADQIAEIIDTEPLQVVDQNGVSRVDSGWVSWQRNRVDARKWIASKLKPKKYGDRIQQEMTGADGAPLLQGVQIKLVRPDADK